MFCENLKDIVIDKQTLIQFNAIIKILFFVRNYILQFFRKLVRLSNRNH